MSSGDLNEALKKYYGRLFPYKLIHDWLNDTNFKFREFSFTLPGDIYIRYLSFNDEFEFRTAVENKLPIKIDAGAVYNILPKFQKQYPGNFQPVQRELVFDIDISDYNDARTCCQESDICQKCWPFMAIGAKVLNKVLREEFGFKHLLFVFSGRRGFHCWVCDREARELKPEARRAIADYLSLVKGGANIVRRVELDPVKGLHPMVSKALAVIDEHFEDLMVEKQDFMGNDQLVQNVIDLAPDDRLLQENLHKFCRLHDRSSTDCWRTMVQVNTEHKRRTFGHNYFLQEVKLHYCFPRLDANVTRGMNHLLKLPFCVHPKTGNVCVPLDINKIDKFQLSSVPNVNNLTPEIMEPYIKLMRDFCDNLKKSNEQMTELQ